MLGVLGIYVGGDVVFAQRKGDRNDGVIGGILFVETLWAKEQLEKTREGVTLAIWWTKISIFSA